MAERCASPSAFVESPNDLFQRSLGRVLLQRTLVLMLALGLAAAAATMWIDLKREKTAVEVAALEFLSSVAPSAAAAAYNYDEQAAENIVTGLFTQRAIIAVQIVNEGDDMIKQTREVPPTLPSIFRIGNRDAVVLSHPFVSPRVEEQIFGEILVTVDRSLVSPEIVDRLLTFFLITTAKNVLFGLLLYIMIFAALTRHTIELAMVARSWRPGAGRVTVPPLPKLLDRTEVADLGARIEDLTETASQAIAEIEVSRDAAVDFSEELRDAVGARTLELEKANKRLKRLAETDSLTGLYNRASLERFLIDALERAVEASVPTTVLLIDVDHFKAYNDFYGHQAGDEALTLVAAFLQQVGNENGCRVARYGGEEFAVLLQAGELSAKRLASSVHRALDLAGIAHEHSTTARQLTISIGIASTEGETDQLTPDLLVSAADDALYEAKRKGRNQTVTSNVEIRQRAKEERNMVSALLDAVEKREFVPFLQPQIDARTGELVGAEALVRWVRGDGQIVSPAVFMQAAIQSGLIAEIDAIMLEELGAFLEAHPGLLPRVSFNLAVQDFKNEAYIDAIVELAKSTQTEIAVEILETVFVDKPSDHFLWQLDVLRDAGIEVEIDDFGTGRASILGLMAIRPDRLKIARELVVPMEEDLDQSHLVCGVLDIAKALSIKVLAEGIETEPVSNRLAQIGCPIQQGFLHGKPTPLEEVFSICQVERSKSKWPLVTHR